jgi:hypothetical protein
MLATSGKRRSTRSNVPAPLHQPGMSLDLRPTSLTKTCLLRKSSLILPTFLPLLNLHSLHLRRLLLLPLFLPRTLLSLRNSTNTLLRLYSSPVPLLYLVYNTIRPRHHTSYLLHHLLSHINPRPRLSHLNLLHLSHQEPYHASPYVTKKLPRQKIIQTTPKTPPTWNHHKSQNPRHAPPLQDKKASHSATWKKWAGKRAKVSAEKQQA